MEDVAGIDSENDLVEAAELGSEPTSPGRAQIILDNDGLPSDGEEQV